MGRRLELVTPFYLDMMGPGVTSKKVALLPQLVVVGRTTTADEVIALIRSAWRESCMGAWYSLFHDTDVVRDELLRALRRSHGVLTLCPLAVVSISLVGDLVIPALQEYAAEDAANGWGGSGFAAAALHHLGSGSSGGSPTEGDTADFDALLAFTHSLQRMIEG